MDDFVVDSETAFYLALIPVLAGLALAFTVRNSLRPGVVREIATGITALGSILIALAAWQHYAGSSYFAVAPSLRAADPCKGRLPSAGAKFSGQVRYIGDGDSLCVGATANPNTWVEVRLDDFDAPGLNSAGGQDAKAALERMTLGRSAQCLAHKKLGDQVVAHCILVGGAIGYLLHRAGIREGGRHQ